MALPLTPALPALGPNAAATAAILALALGLVSCFAGYRLFHFFLAVYGFAIGAVVGATLTAAYLPGQDFAALAGLVIGGLVGGALLRAFYYVGVFVIGGLAGLLLADALHLQGALGDLGPLLCAIGCGALALILQKILIALSTAFSGAWAALGGLVALLGRGPAGLLDPFQLPRGGGPWRDLPDDAIFYAWLALGTIGAVVQLGARERRRDRPERRPPA